LKNAKNENAKEEGQPDWCPFPEDKPLGPEDSRWVTKCWELCCKFWNGLGLKPECRYFFHIPNQYADEVIVSFKTYSLTEIKNAMVNYKGHRDADMEVYKPAMTYGSLATFLISGVPRYFDDSAIDEQFEIKKEVKNAKGV
jgi:hypothetical protein